MVKRIKKMVKAGTKQAVGKVRRFTNGTLRKKYVQRKLARRQGECLRCGACCKLLFRCPLLVEHSDGSTACRIHKRRPENCRIFPLDERDISERDHLSPLLGCGYHFAGKDDIPDEEETAELTENAI